jgi:hypothetical protein
MKIIEKINKFAGILSLLIITGFTVYSFSPVSNGISFGKVKLVDTASALHTYYNGTDRMTIDNSSGDVTFTAPNGSNVLSVGNIWVHATTGVSEKFYVEGNSRMRGTLILDASGGTEDSHIEVKGTKSYIQFPPLTTTQRDALTPAKGMVIYNSTDDKFQGYGGVSPTWHNLD